MKRKDVGRFQTFCIFLTQYSIVLYLKKLTLIMPNLEKSFYDSFFQIICVK